jgi:hypothetical protein
LSNTKYNGVIPSNEKIKEKKTFDVIVVIFYRTCVTAGAL